LLLAGCTLSRGLSLQGYSHAPMWCYMFALRTVRFWSTSRRGAWRV
jgi:hypothetical protein